MILLSMNQPYIYILLQQRLREQNIYISINKHDSYKHAK